MNDIALPSIGSRVEITLRHRDDIPARVGAVTQVLSNEGLVYVTNANDRDPRVGREIKIFGQHVDLDSFAMAGDSPFRARLV